MASPELQVLIDMMRTMDLFASGDIHVMREGMGQAPPYPKPDDIEWEAVDAGGVACEWVTPEYSEPGRTIVYYHGGGYGIGSAEAHRGLCSNLARATRSRVLNVDYRLAPEHPYPAALDDCVAAYRWAVAQGADPAKTALGGDSAGGGLVLGSLITLRDAGDRLPGAGLCLSPWVDMTLSNATIDSLSDVDPMLDRKTLEVFREAYLGDRDPKTPGASPLWGELAGLPRLLIQVGTAEVLLGEVEAFRDKAQAAGVEVHFEAWDDMIHVWQTFADMLPEGREAIAAIGRYVDKQLG